MKPILWILALTSSLLAQMAPMPGPRQNVGISSGAMHVVQAVQNLNTGTATSISEAISSTAGNLLVAYVREGSNNTDNFTVTDNLSQTWTQAGTYNSFNSTNRSAIFYVPNSGAVSSVTANFTTGGGVTRPGIIVYEIWGAAKNSPLDVGPVLTAGAATTSVTSGTLTTNQTNDMLLFAVDVDTNQSSFTPGGSYSLPVSNARQAFSNLVVSSIQTNVTASMTWGTAGTNASSEFLAFGPVTPPPTITTTSLPNATISTPYSTTLAASKGVPPYSWSVISGSLPTGLSLSSGGTISGTPSSTGTSSFTVKVTDSNSATATQPLTLTVNSVSSPLWFASYNCSGGVANTTATSGCSFFNAPLPSCANAGTCISSNSATWINGSLVNVYGYGGGANPEHLSIGGYGVGVLFATASNSTVKTVSCDTPSWGGNNTCNTGGSVSFPIPNWISSASIPSGTDHSTVIIYTTNDGSGWYGKELNCWGASSSGTGQLSCIVGTIDQVLPNGTISNTTTKSDSTLSAVENNGWGSMAFPVNEPAINSNGTFVAQNYQIIGATAAGTPFSGGIIRQGEVATCVNATSNVESVCSTAIPHALDFQSQGLNGNHWACPGTHKDTNSGCGSSCAAEGMQFFLPSSYNISANDAGWSRLEIAIAYALQNKGAFVLDYTGGGAQFQGETDANLSNNGETISWSSLGISDGASLSHIPWSQMKIISGGYCDGGGTY